jgi:hypothetical protein
VVRDRRLVAVDLGPILSDADAALKDVMTRAGVAA